LGAKWGLVAHSIIKLVAGAERNLHENDPVFSGAVLRKRAYIKLEWCERILAEPLARAAQSDGRIRLWGIVPEFGNRALRIVTLADRETVHSAFFARDFKAGP
jgi:hypothetical protein